MAESLQVFEELLHALGENRQSNEDDQALQELGDDDHDHVTITRQKKFSQWARRVS